MPTISASEARQTFPAQLDRVEAGEEVAITRHGRVVAILVRPDSLAVRRTARAWAAAEATASRLQAAAREPLPPAVPTVTDAEALVAAVDADRGARAGT